MASDLQIPTQELNAFDLPGVCVVTGAQDGVTFKPVKFWWYPRWVPLLIFFPWGGLILALIVALATRRKAEGELPFTDHGWNAWKRSQWIWGLSIFAFLVGVFGTIVLITAAASGSLAGWIAWAGAAVTVALPIGGWFLAKPTMVQVRKIDNGRLFVRIPSADAAARIHAHLFPPSDGIVQAQPAMAPAAVASRAG